MKKNFVIVFTIFTIVVFSSTVYATQDFTINEETSTIIYEENSNEFLNELPVPTNETQIENPESVNQEEISSALTNTIKNSGFSIFLCLIALIVLLVIVFKNKKKNKKRNSIKNELEGYIKATQKHTYSGIVSVNQNGIFYSRGNKSVRFEISIDKETVLAPFMVDNWFADKNYNYREAEMILSDISTFLTENKICKNVKVLSDEEYEELFETSENDSEECETEDYVDE